MSTCNWLGLETLGHRPIMSKNLPRHWFCDAWSWVLFGWLLLFVKTAWTCKVNPIKIEC
jgi:hypothetical protein